MNNRLYYRPQLQRKKEQFIWAVLTSFCLLSGSATVSPMIHADTVLTDKKTNAVHDVTQEKELAPEKEITQSDLKSNGQPATNDQSAKTNTAENNVQAQIAEKDKDHSAPQQPKLDQQKQKLTDQDRLHIQESPQPSSKQTTNPNRGGTQPDSEKQQQPSLSNQNTNQPLQTSPTPATVNEPKTITTSTTTVPDRDKITADSKNIKTINGKKYYVDNNGQIQKNFALDIDGQTLYFAKDTGELTTTPVTYQTGLANLNDSYTENNAVYNTSTESFKTTDGYLTANSWYRPKKILQNGTQWRPATNSDYRPLLMDWWPDKKTQVNYLNFMQHQFGCDKTYTVMDDQAELNFSAQQVQVELEKKIGQMGTTQWLQDLIAEFVKTQPNWNMNSESPTTGDDKDHLQGGALLYGNSPLTSKANSNYRLLNRTPTNQQGHPAYTTDNSLGGYEFLLANDVDNSNPVVQAEQLNWMYYLLNFGSIVKHDAAGNFDSIRVDAVDNVDADLLQIAADYFKDAYKVDQNDQNANQHLSILEDWSDNDAQYVQDHGSNQAAMDNKFRLSLKYALTMPNGDGNHNARSGLEPLISNSLVNRANDQTENEAIPNYSFVRAHDSEVQTVIAEIIKEKIDPNSDGLTFTLDQLKKAFEIYNADQLQTVKQFTQYNIPSTYALLLTNKDTTPRVYYGDMYTDDGQYMAQKSPYYAAIDTLLRARKQFAAGGQSMAVKYVAGTSQTQNAYHGVLTSVRYGKGVLNANDLGNVAARTQGIAVIESNEPNLRLNSADRIVINMGKAHCRQAYRPLLLTTASGLATYQTDEAAPASCLKYTNDEGQLIFDASEIVGQSNPQVSGFLAAWVPLGADPKQDARTESSATPSQDGKTLHSNAALDSQVIYEGFSNFQAFPTNNGEYANVKIAQNAAQFKDWGITYFELPPQYRSSTDKTFLDSIIQNGYAFTDRYDLGFETPTKYGTAAQLVTAIKALHAQDMRVIADWVPDQIYNLPGEEVVTASRVNNFGEQTKGAVINKTLYVAKTVGGGKYQAKYGGAFLKKIAKLYPELFTVKQLSTGVALDSNQRIKQWSAKYFNGSNIQGRGAFYVLKDWSSNKYFKISPNETFLPKQLLNLPANTGFTIDSTGVTYYSMSGYQAKQTFIEDEQSNWYYFDKTGHMCYGFKKINGTFYYFLPNGIELQNAFFKDEQNNLYFFDAQGQAFTDDYLMNDLKQWRYFKQDGTMARGLTKVVFKGKKSTQFFGNDGYQVKGAAIRDQAGHLRYFANDSGDMLTSTFAEIKPNVWIYLDTAGIAVTGKQTINGQELYFDQNGYQLKGQALRDQEGQLHYYDADSGELLTNRFERVAANTWVYLDATGTAVTGKQTINGQELYFDQNGYQLKGQALRDQDGQLHYYDADSGELLTNRFERVAANTWVYLDTTGTAVTGKQTINGQELYFEQNGYQVKGRVVKDQTGNEYYYAADSGELQINYFEHLFSAQSESPNTFKVRQNDIPNVQIQNAIERKDIEKEISEQNIK